MLIGKNIIYLELQKTGSTHIKQLLKTVLDEEIILIGKHNTISEVQKKLEINTEDKLIIGNIRNPWDWYVSLWAYGCMGKGEIYNNTAKIRLRRILKNPRHLFYPKRIWQNVYQDSDNPEHFRKWIRLILTNAGQYIGNGYKQSPVSDTAGLFTYRYLKLYTDDFHHSQRQLHTYSEMQRYEKQYNILDYVIKNETLVSDLKNILTKCDFPRETIENEIIPKAKQRTNVSKRKEYTYYYNQASRDLVYENDKLIIDKYNYSFR